MNRQSLGGRKSLGGGLDPTMEMKQSAFSFPTMKLADIKVCLDAISCRVTDSELRDPSGHKDTHQRVLETLVELCTGVTEAELKQPAFDGLVELNNPELHEDSVPRLNSFRAIGKMMKICGVEDFSMRDISHPDPKRFRRQLSGILNFAKFREERMSMLLEITGKREEALNNLRRVQLENEKLTDRLATLRLQTQNEASEIAALDEEVLELEKEIEANNRKQVDLREDIQQLKSFNTSLKEGLSARQNQVEEAQEAKKKLTSLVVSSPARFRKQLSDAEKTLKMEEEDAEDAEAKVSQFVTWINGMEETQTQVKGALESITALQNEAERENKMKKELKNVQELVAEKREALQSLDQNVHHISRQAGRTDEKLKHLRKQCSDQNEESQAGMETLHKQLLEAENERVSLKSALDRGERDVINLEREAEAEAQLMEQEKSDMIQSYQRLEKVVIGHLRSLREAVEATNDSGVSENMPSSIVV